MSSLQLTNFQAANQCSSNSPHAENNPNIGVLPCPLTDSKEEKQPGYYYDNEGLCIEIKPGSKNVYVDDVLFPLDYDQLILRAKTAYGESSVGFGVVSREEIFAIASVHKINKKAYGVSAPSAIKLNNTATMARNNHPGMKIAIAAVINAELGGHDYSNGAQYWDGAEQAYINGDICSNGRIEYHVNSQGWTIAPAHYSSWQTAITNKFGNEKFNVPAEKYAPANCMNYRNKDKIRNQSTAQYGLTIFWKGVNINKPSSGSIP